MRRLAAICLAALAPALAACGGADKTPLSASQYRAKLTSLCVQSAADAKALGQPGANASSLADYFDKAAALDRKRQKQLVALVPPAALKADHSQLVAQRAETISALQEGAKAFRGGGDPVTTLERFSDRVTAAAQRIGPIVTRLKVPKCRERTAARGAAAGSA